MLQFAVAPGDSSSALVQADAGALLVGSGPFFLSRRRELIALATRHKLLASYVTRQYPEAGGLMSYGPNQTDAYRRAGIYVGRILKGAKPADLPVELPTKYELVIKAVAVRSAGARSASLDAAKAISDPAATRSQLLIRSPRRGAVGMTRGSSALALWPSKRALIVT